LEIGRALWYGRHADNARQGGDQPMQGDRAANDPGTQAGPLDGVRVLDVSR